MSMNLTKPMRWVVPVAALVMGTVPSLADVIDGNWCHQDGRRFSIRGPEIVTPKGNHLQGSYSRHYFTYVVPPNEPSAGETISMTLRNEFTVHLQVGASSAAEEWKRCSPDITDAGAPPRAQARRPARTLAG